MNRFEALHALGLEDGASDEDVRLACYGIEKAVASFDVSGEEHLAHRAEGLVDHARASKKFLLSSRSKTAARKVHEASANRKARLSVTPTEEKTARLRGYERLRLQILSYFNGERSKRRASIILLVVCIVVSFILLRYLRGMPRVVGFTVIGAAAIAGSTILTSAHMQIKKVKPYLLDIDARILELRRALGLVPAGGEEAGDGAAAGSVAAGAAAAAVVSEGVDEEDQGLEADAYETDEDLYDEDEDDEA